MPEPSRSVRPPPSKPVAARPASQPAKPRVATSLIPAPQQRPQMSVPYDPGYASLGGPAPIFVQAKPSWSRPGNVTAACVIAFIVGGFSLMGAMMWLTMSRVSRAFDSAFEGQWLVFGVVDLAWQSS